MRMTVTFSSAACLVLPYFPTLSYKLQDLREKFIEHKMCERKTNLMHLLYVFIVAVEDALHVSGVFAHRQER
jgi:hypothetical protein